jgi:hypothetical protein
VADDPPADLGHQRELRDEPLRRPDRRDQPGLGRGAERGLDDLGDRRRVSRSFRSDGDRAG